MPGVQICQIIEWNLLVSIRKYVSYVSIWTYENENRIKWG
jgi:hypothetical protein